MYKTLEILKLKIYFIFWIPKSNLIRYFFEMILIMYFKFNYSKNYLRFFIIDFRNSFMHSLRRFFANAEFVLIDDGFYTFVAYEKFISRNIFLPFSNYKSIKGKFIKYLYFGKSYKRLINSPIKLFSIYADEINSPHIISE